MSEGAGNERIDAPHVGWTWKQKSNPTIVVLYSIGGAVGKSQIAAALHKLRRDFNPPPLLVDADLVGATLTLANSVEREHWDLETIITSERLLNEEMEIPRNYSRRAALGNDYRDLDASFSLARTFLPSSEWAVCKTIIDDTENLELDRSNFSRFLARHNAFARFDAALEEVQKQQGRFYSDIPAQRRFWRSLCATALNQGRDVIVDLPAQGPVGVAIARLWHDIVRDALDLEAKYSGKRSVRLRRLLVHTDETHPLLDRFRAASVEADLFIGNMIDPDRKDYGQQRFIPVASIDEPVRQTVISYSCKAWTKIGVALKEHNDKIPSETGRVNLELPPLPSFNIRVKAISDALFEGIE